MKGLLLHPFAVAIYSLILGSLFIFNNEKHADGSIPTFFYGNWSIYLGYTIYIVGGLYVAYSVYKTLTKKKS